MDEHLKELSARLRERFHAVMLRDPRSISELSRESGMSRQLLNWFISGSDKTRRVSLYKVEQWIMSEEKRLGIT